MDRKQMDIGRSGRMRTALTASLLAAVLAGCSSGSGNTGANGTNGKTNGAEGGQPSAAQANGAGGNAVEDVGYPDSISYWVAFNANVSATMKSMSDVGAYRKIKEITGTTVDFKYPSSDPDQAKEQFNLMIASNNLPDVIETNWITADRGPDSAIESGTILKLNDLIDKYAPNFKAYLEEHPDIEKMVKTDEGNLYAFPFIRSDKMLMVFYGPIFRQDWLDRLGLQAPETIDEWEKTLTAFRDRDANGNGQKDEIPFLLEYRNVRNGALNDLIGAWGIAGQFYQEGGKVKYGEIQPAWKDFLTTMNRWYKEKLIDPDFATTDGQLKDAKVTGDKLGAFYGYAGSSIGKYIGLMQEKMPQFQLVAAPHPTLNKGDTPVLGQLDKPYTGASSAAISGSAKNPEQIVKWLDFAYGEEGNMLFNFGIEGESYTMKDGYPTYTEQIMHHPDGLPITQSMSQYIRASYGGPFVQDKEYMEQYMQLDTQKAALDTWGKAKNEIIMPLVTLTADENKEYSSIMSDVNTYAEEMMVKFIMGAEPLDHFDRFVDTIKGFGIERAIEIQQAALDRYNSR